MSNMFSSKYISNHSEAITIEASIHFLLKDVSSRSNTQSKPSKYPLINPVGLLSHRYKMCRRCRLGSRKKTQFNPHCPRVHWEDILSWLPYMLCCQWSHHRRKDSYRTRQSVGPQSQVPSKIFRYTYLEPITVKALTQTISDLALHFGEGDTSSKKKPMSRPYGVALLIAGVDERGPCIYQTDPSGTMI